MIISNLDTFLFTGHNFYLYLDAKDNRFHFMPWDMNLAFASFTSAGSIEQQLHLSLAHPHSGEAKIVDRLLAIPAYNELYRGHIRQFLATHFTAAKFHARVDALQGVLVRADEAADAAWKACFTVPGTNPATRPAIPRRPVVTLMGWQGQPAIPLKEFATRRVESINEQLAGETDGYVPGYRCPLRLVPRRTASRCGIRQSAVAGDVDHAWG